VLAGQTIHGVTVLYDATTGDILGVSTIASRALP
jgi:hypothetical protein